MAIDSINRDPEEIEKYANKVCDYYDTMNAILDASKKTIDTYKLELDQNSFALCEKFDDQVNTVKVQLESYMQLADILKRDARELKDIVDRFRR